MCAAVGHRSRAGTRLGRRLQLRVHRQVDGSADTATDNYVADRPLHCIPTAARCLAPPGSFSRSAVKKGPQNPISEVGGKIGGRRDQPLMTDTPVSITLCAQPGVPVPARGCGPGAKPTGRAGLTWRPEWRVDACGPGRQASPPRRPAAAVAGPSVTARDPAPAPAGLPLRQGRAGRPAPPRRRAFCHRGPCPRLAAISRSTGRQPWPGHLCGGRT